MVDELELRESTRRTVVAESADICIGGRLSDFASVGASSAELRVCRTKRKSNQNESCRQKEREKPTLPRLRVIKLVVLAATLALLPNSSTRGSNSRGGGTWDKVWRLRRVGDGGAFSFSLSRREAVLRRKLRPRIDLRPLLRGSSSSGSCLSGFGDGVFITLPVDVLREKNGIPEGVRRGLRRLERDRPGLVVTTDGVAAAGVPAVWLPMAVLVVLLLLILDVRVRERTVEAVLSLRKVLRIREPVDSWSCEFRDDDDEVPLARPTMSFVEAAIRRGYSCSEV